MNRLSYFLSNLRISTRLRIILGVQMIAFLAIAVVLVINSPRLATAFFQQQEAQSELLIADQINQHMLNARRQAGDFFLRFNNNGYENAYNIYIVGHNQHLSEIDSLTSGLIAKHSQSGDDNKDIQDLNTTIRQSLLDYNTTFSDVTSFLIPQREEIIESIEGTIEEMDEWVDTTDSAQLDSYLHEFENQFSIYRWRTIPAHASYDQFVIVQSRLKTAFEQDMTQLNVGIFQANLSSALIYRSKAQQDSIRADFDSLVKLDRTIAGEIQEYTTDLQVLEPFIEQLIFEADANFSIANQQLIEIGASYQFLILVGFVLSLIVSFILVGLIIKSIDSPLERITLATEEIAEGNYQRRIDIKSKDELGQLGNVLNTMASAIEVRNLQLRDALAEAQEANRLKDDFLATMSHELRTPLNAIIGFLGIMEMTTELDPKNTHRLQRARANSERLLNLINDILDISRIEAGRMRVAKSTIEIAPFIEDLSTQLQSLADGKAIDFRVELDANLPKILLTDEDALAKIITNLVGNAMKFTDKGEVNLRLVYQDSESWCIEVQDKGIGIPPHLHDIIFDRFRQVDGSSTREYGGSGLGLAIVSGLSRELGGSVRVESELGMGSTFIVTLPLEVEQKDAVIMEEGV